jgi:hypothetical protein
MTDPHHQHRRAFVRKLALGATAAAVGARARADDQKEKDKDKDKDRPAAPATPTEADARMAVVLARFGGQLDEAARKAVRDEVEAQTKRAEALRKFALDNGDGPFPVFHPFRAPLA